MKQVEKWLLLDGLLIAGIAFLWHQRHFTLERVFDFLSSWSVLAVIFLFVLCAWVALIALSKALGYVVHKAFPQSPHFQKTSVFGLLVLSVIFVILFGMTMTCGRGSRTKARDAKRMSDIRQIISAQEMYFGETGRYYQSPVMPKEIVGGTNVYLTVPSDPGAKGATYGWIDNSADSTKFCAYAVLEVENTTHNGCQGGCQYYIGSRDGNFYRKDEPKVLADCAVNK